MKVFLLEVFFLQSFFFPLAVLRIKIINKKKKKEFKENPHQDLENRFFRTSQYVSLKQLGVLNIGKTLILFFKKKKNSNTIQDSGIHNDKHAKYTQYHTFGRQNNAHTKTKSSSRRQGRFFGKNTTILRAHLVVKNIKKKYGCIFTGLGSIHFLAA